MVHGFFSHRNSNQKTGRIFFLNNVITSRLTTYQSEQAPIPRLAEHQKLNAMRKEKKYIIPVLDVKDD